MDSMPPTTAPSANTTTNNNNTIYTNSVFPPHKGPIVTVAMLTCQLCTQSFSMSGKLSDHRTPVLAVNPSLSIEGPYCIACAGAREGLKGFWIDEARVALCILLYQRQQTQQHQLHQQYNTAHLVPPSLPVAVGNNSMASSHKKGTSSIPSQDNAEAAQHLPHHILQNNKSNKSHKTVARQHYRQDAPGDAPGKTDAIAPNPSSDNDSSSNSSNSQHSSPVATKKRRTLAPGRSRRSHSSTSTSTTSSHNTSSSSGPRSSTGSCPWSPAEDRLVLETVQRHFATHDNHPFTKWSDLAQSLPGRMGKQVRDRWHNHLDPTLDHSTFTLADDRILYQAFQRHGKKWVDISNDQELWATTRKSDKNNNKTSSGGLRRRSENSIKNRYYSAAFKKFVRTVMKDETLFGTHGAALSSSSSSSSSSITSSHSNDNDSKRKRTEPDTKPSSMVAIVEEDDTLKEDKEEEEKEGTLGVTVLQGN